MYFYLPIYLPESLVRPNPMFSMKPVHYEDGVFCWNFRNTIRWVKSTILVTFLANITHLKIWHFLGWTPYLWNKVLCGGIVNSAVDAVIICWNGVEKGHQAIKWKKPKDPVTYNKNRKAFIDNRAKSSDENKSGVSGKLQKGTPEYHCKQWEANACSMVNGLLYIKCKTCGLNTNHGSWNQDQ